MNRVIKNIMLDLDRQQMRSDVTAHVKQADHNSREIILTLRENNEARQVQPDESLRLRLKKHSGKVIYADLPASTDGKVHIVLTDDMLSSAGLAQADIEISSGEAVLSSFVFYLDVEERVISEDSIIDTDEYGALQSLISDAETAIEACTSAAEGVNDAKDAANTAAGAANSAAELANEKAGAADTAAQSAQTAAEVAQMAAGTANSAASDANTAADRANAAAELVEDTDVGQLTAEMTKAKSDISALQSGKVDKEIGKGLSSNDFTDAYKSAADALVVKELTAQFAVTGTYASKVTLDSVYQFGRLIIIDGKFDNIPDGWLSATQITIKHRTSPAAYLPATDTPVHLGANNTGSTSGAFTYQSTGGIYGNASNISTGELRFQMTFICAGQNTEPEPDPDTPAYVTSAADNLVQRIQSHLAGSTQNLKLAFQTDMHCGYSTDLDNISAKHAGQALKRIRATYPVDVVIGGGDYTTGGNETTAQSALEDIGDCLGLLDGAGMVEEGLPYFFVLGNHDDAPYRATGERVTEMAMKLVFQATHSNSGFEFDNPLYGYRDFESAKIRVICLNVRDTWGWESEDNPPESSDGTAVYRDVLNIGGDQLQWLVNEALDMSGKSDAAEWEIVVCSHGRLTQQDSYYKGRYFNTANVITILDAYTQGQSGSVQADKVDSPYSVTDVAYDFTGPNRASVICCIHGHNHAYLEERLGTTRILAIGCPNVLNGRERQSQDGQTYTKTADSADDTSFCIVSIDRTNHKIYADHYGPGYDREWDYTAPDPGPSYTNQIPISTDSSGGIYNGTGYKVDVRLNSSGGETAGVDTVATGFMPFSKGDVLRVRGGYWDGNGACYIQLYDASKELIQPINYSGMLEGKFGAVTFGGSDTGTVRDMTYTCDNITGTTSSGKSVDDTAYVRISCRWLEEDTLIATVNEEIT